MVKRLIKRTAGWLQLNTDKPAATKGWGIGDNKKNTYFQTGILSVDTLNNATGFNGEERQWVTNEDGTKSFGNYSEERWNTFLEDIKTNGVTEPIVIEVWVDGSIKIWEGNHRLEACRVLGITQIPAKVYYMGGSESTYKIS